MVQVNTDTDPEAYQGVVGRQLIYHAEHDNSDILHEVFDQADKQEREVSRSAEEIEKSSQQARKVVSAIPDPVIENLKINREDLTGKIENIFLNGSTFLPLEYRKDRVSDTLYFSPTMMAASIAHTKNRFIHVFDRFGKCRFFSEPLIDQIKLKVEELSDKGEIIFIAGQYLEDEEWSNPNIDELFSLSKKYENLYIYLVNLNTLPLLNFMLIDGSAAIVEAIRPPDLPVKYCKAYCACVYPEIIELLQSKVDEWLISPQTVRVRSKEHIKYPIPEDIKKVILGHCENYKIHEIQATGKYPGMGIAEKWIEDALGENDPDQSSRKFTMPPQKYKDRGYEQLILFHGNFKLTHPEVIEEIKRQGYKVFAYYDNTILGKGQTEEIIYSSLTPEQKGLPFIWVHIEESRLENVLKDVYDLSPFQGEDLKTKKLDK